jgi:protein-L-isoaspartate(D-aspartate) O-methyltransferase
MLASCSLLDSAVTSQEAAMDPTQQGFVVEGIDRAGIGEPVREAMSRVPRHEFVSTEMSQLAYRDRALPIAHNQTISQPYIVALMTEAGGVVRGSRVLEVGTGSGYQAAVLAEMGAKVFSVEIIEDLAKEATARLASLGYDDIEIKTGDGWQGWEEHGPYDVILVTAASPSFPPKLLEQLAERGRLIMPLERAAAEGEILMSVQRVDDHFVSRELGGVKFVPLTGSGRYVKGGITSETIETPAVVEMLFGPGVTPEPATDPLQSQKPQLHSTGRREDS